MKIIRAVGYIRVSTAEQARTGISLETQEAEIRIHAEKHDMVLTEIYVDRGVTARKQLDRREEFMRMMRDVDAGNIDIILVLRLDRWFRNVYDYHHMINQHLAPHNVDWCAIKEDYDTTTTNGRLMINLRLAIAEQECDTDSDRIKDVQSNMLHNRHWPFGMAPFGFVVENKQLVKNPATQAHVSHFFEHFLENGSLRGAICSVNKTFGTAYDYAYAQKMAKRAVYYGEYNGIEDFCPPYLTQEQRARMTYLLSKNVRVRRSGENFIHLFTGLLICKDCGCRLCAQIIRNGEKVYYTYRCQRSMDNGLCNNGKSTREKNIEKFLFDYLETELEGYVFGIQIKAKTIHLTPDNRPQIKAKQERVKELFINGAIDINEYRHRVDELEQKITFPHCTQPQANMARLKQLLETDIFQLYAGLSREEKRSFWRGIIREVGVHRGVPVGAPVLL